MKCTRFISIEEASGTIQAEEGVIYIFEDRWLSRRELIEKRLKAHNGEFRRIHARKCRIYKPDAEQARSFLEINHIYGYAKCKFRYALEYEGETVAVSTFSEPRPITRRINGKDTEVLSYEWVRAASLPDCRVCGGMGRLLNAFIRDVNPDDIMAYADREWSEGAVYEKLGFVRTALTEPVEFYVDPASSERFPLKKIGRDRKARGMCIPEGARIIRNLGSIKYILTRKGKP